MLCRWITTLIVSGKPSCTHQPGGPELRGVRAGPGDIVGQALLVGLEADLHAVEAGCLELADPRGGQTDAAGDQIRVEPGRTWRRRSARASPGGGAARRRRGARGARPSIAASANTRRHSSVLSS